MAISRKLSRPMLSTMFIAGGINALRNVEAHAERAKPVTDQIIPAVKNAAPSAPIPADAQTLVKINAGVQILAGLGLATGRAPRLCSLALAGSLVPTTAAGHRFWEETDPDIKRNQTQHFLKNVSMLGGLLISAGDTEGDPSLAWRAKKTAKAAKKATKGAGKSASKAVKS